MRVAWLQALLCLIAPCSANVIVGDHTEVVSLWLSCCNCNCIAIPVYIFDGCTLMQAVGMQSLEALTTM
jgi:hypothetical protein